MRTAPDAEALIAVARAAFKADVLPHLPPDRLHAALMVLNALGIVQRQLAGGTARREQARAVLAPFAPGAETLDAINAALAATLRSGASDSDGAALHAALVAVARAETEESNPRARSLGES